MNKYQKAYCIIDGYVLFHSTAEKDERFKELIKALSVLNELVIKATPKAPDFEGDGYDDRGQLNYDTWICPNCEKKYEVDYDKYEYCPNCGQALRWEEEE